MSVDLLILLVYTALLGTPLVFWRSATQDDLPKVSFLLWGSALLAALVLYRSISLRRWAFPSCRLLLAIVLFALVRAIGALFSPSLDAALADLSLLAGCVVVAVLILLDRPIAEFTEHRGLPLLVLVGGVASLLGILQSCGVDVVRGDAEGQAISTLGNPNFAGGLACALLPLALAIGIAPGDGRVRVGMFLAAPCLVWEGIASASRGAWLAGMTGVCVFGAFLLFGRVPSSVRRLRRPALAIATGFLLVSLGIGASTRVGGRFVAMFTAEGASHEVRPSLWGGAVRMVRDEPWRGHGTGGFAAAYVPYRDVDEAIRSGDASRVEDPHCEPLRLAAENGAMGMIAAGFLLVSALLCGRPALARETGLRQHLVAVGILSSLSSLVAFGLVNPLGIVPALSFLGWVLLASLGALRAVPKGETRVYRPTRVGILLCALPGLAGLVALAALATSRLHDDILRGEAMRQPDAKERLLRRASQDDADAHFLLAQLYSDREHHPDLCDDDRAAAHARAAVTAEPWNGHSWTQLGACEGRAGRLDEAEKDFLEAIRLEPAYPQAHAGLAEVLRLRGRIGEADREQKICDDIVGRMRERGR